MNKTKEKNYYIWIEETESNESSGNRRLPEEQQREVHRVAVANHIQPDLFEKAVIHESSGCLPTGAQSADLANYMMKCHERFGEREKG